MSAAAILQRHYTSKEIAQQWQGVSESTVFRIFRDEPGVMRIGDVNSKRRVKISLRIPQDVMERVYRRMTQ